MTDLKGKVAVVTGAASGLGRAMALAFADEGMHVALGDVADVSDTFAQVEAKGVSALALRVDVSRQEDVERFAQLVDRDLGGADLVCNNAGVSPLAAAWEGSLGDWQWIVGVNLWGVIHGVRSFVPRLMARGSGHVVNTASVAGLISPPGSAAYNVTKHAVVATARRSITTCASAARRSGSRCFARRMCPPASRTPSATGRRTSSRASRRRRRSRASRC